MPTIPDLVDRVITAMEDLAGTGEAVDEEWQYVQDLLAVWTARLREVAGTNAGTARHDQVVAIDRLAAEAAAIADPHRAIDWLSTLPQAALLALGERAA